MGRTIIYPAGLRFQQELLRACLDMRALNREPDTVLLDDIDDTLRKLREGLEHLENNVDMKIEDPVQEAHHKCTVVIPAMNAIRTLGRSSRDDRSRRSVASPELSGDAVCEVGENGGKGGSFSGERGGAPRFLLSFPKPHPLLFQRRLSLLNP